MTQIDSNLTHFDRQKEEIALDRGSFNRTMVAQNQDPNRFEVFEGALRAKIAIEIQYTISKFRPNANWYCFERIYQMQRFRKVLSKNP